MALDLRNIFPPRREICEVRFLSAVLQREKPANDGGSKKNRRGKISLAGGKALRKSGREHRAGEKGGFCHSLI